MPHRLHRVLLATQPHPDRLAELSISLQRLARLGFPAIWPPEG